MKQWLYKLMNGRYGSDQLGKFLLILSLILLVAGMFASTILTWAALGILIYSYFRMFSKNKYARYQENLKYLTWKNKVTGWWRQKIDQLKQRKTHRFYKCPKCGVIVRVPRGKGKIKISCPKCYNTFIKKT